MCKDKTTPTLQRNMMMMFDMYYDGKDNIFDYPTDCDLQSSPVFGEPLDLLSFESNSDEDMDFDDSDTTEWSDSDTLSQVAPPDWDDEFVRKYTEMTMTMEEEYLNTRYTFETSECIEISDCRIILDSQLTIIMP